MKKKTPEWYLYKMNIKILCIYYLYKYLFLSGCNAIKLYMSVLYKTNKMLLKV